MSTATNFQSRRESIYQKAERILSDPRRVETIRAQGSDFWVGVVTGDHGRYPAFSIDPAFAERHGIDLGTVGCNGHRGAGFKLCAHAIVAEEMRRRGEAS